MKLVRGKDSLYLIAAPRHKRLEIGYHNALTIHPVFDLHCSIRTRCSGAGFLFSIQLFGLFFEISFLDTRQWNWNENRFYTDEEERAEGLKAAAGFRARLVDLNDTDDGEDE